MALVLDGTNGVSLVQDGVVTAADLASGAITAGALPAGSVLQVVSVDTAAFTAVTTTTFTDTGLSASITPSSTSSKILVLCNPYLLVAQNDSSAAEGTARLSRNSEAATGAPRRIYGYDYGGSGQLVAGAYAFNWLDSPASTSSVTYTLQLKLINGDTFQVNNAESSTITLMEIAG